MSENNIKVTTGKSGKLRLKPAKAAKKSKVSKQPKVISSGVGAMPSEKIPVSVKAVPVVSSTKLSTISGTSSKATLYVDVDDEITAIIEKVRSSKSGIIALVLPKRAAVMQSIVNMKLLQRAADQNGKHLVLVTNEASLLPLAGLVGLHVAETPTSKPVIPPAPTTPSDEPDSVEESMEVTDGSGVSPKPEEFDPAAKAQVSVGELAGMPSALGSTVDEEIILENDASDNTENAFKPDVVPVKKNKKLAVPSFAKFRLRLVLGLFLVAVLITGWFIATTVLPRAEVAIATNSQFITTNLNITFDTAARTIDVTNKIIPASAQTMQKNYSQQVAATGQQNNGTKASGTVYFALKDCENDTVSIPAGSGVSVGGNTYITQAAVSLNSATIGSKCNPTSLQSVWSTTVKVVAIAGGAKFNAPSGTNVLTPSNISGASSLSASVNADIDGGTDNIVKIVSQADIDSAKAKIAAQDTAALKQSLRAGLQAKGLLAVQSTFIAGEQKTTSSVNAGDAAETVTVSVTVPYTMLGIQQDALRQLVIANIKSKIDAKKQKILDDGVAKATFTQQNPGSATSAVVATKVESVAGPELSVAELKQQMIGKKAGDIRESIGALPGVTEVEVKYSPFWVQKAPKNTEKITVTILKPTGAK